MQNVEILHATLYSGRHEAALEHFAAIIACPSSPSYYQAFYLQQFLDCVTATTEAKVWSGVLLKDSAQPVLQRACCGALWAESWAILQGCLGVAEGLNSRLSTSRVFCEAQKAIRHLSSHIAGLRKDCHGEPWPWAEYTLSLEALHCSQAVLKALALGLQGSAPVLELPLPGIDASRVRVHSDDQVCHAGAESRALPEEDWRLLEAPLMAGTRPACQLLRNLAM